MSAVGQCEASELLFFVSLVEFLFCTGICILAVHPAGAIRAQTMNFLPPFSTPVHSVQCQPMTMGTAGRSWNGRAVPLLCAVPDSTIRNRQSGLGKAELNVKILLRNTT